MMKLCLFVLLTISSSIFAQIGNLRSGLEAYTSGENRMKVNDWQGAALDYTNAIAADPGYAEAYYKRSVVYTKLGRLNEAIKDQNEALRLNPGILKIYDERAKIKMLVEDYPGAVSDFTKAIELAPISQPSIQCQQAHAQLAAEDYAGAVNT
jgi:tetratricopeptide (TPR) repeat protein